MQITSRQTKEKEVRCETPTRFHSPPPSTHQHNVPMMKIDRYKKDINSDSQKFPPAAASIDETEAHAHIAHSQEPDSSDRS